MVSRSVSEIIQDRRLGSDRVLGTPKKIVCNPYEFEIRVYNPRGVS